MLTDQVAEPHWSHTFARITFSSYCIIHQSLSLQCAACMHPQTCGNHLVTAIVVPCTGTHIEAVPSRGRLRGQHTHRQRCKP